MDTYKEETKVDKTSDAITKCILEDGTVYEYVLCSEDRDNKFVDLRFMEYLGVGKNIVLLVLCLLIQKKIIIFGLGIKNERNE